MLCELLRQIVLSVACLFIGIRRLEYAFLVVKSQRGNRCPCKQGEYPYSVIHFITVFLYISWKPYKVYSLSEFRFYVFYYNG